MTWNQVGCSRSGNLRTPRAGTTPAMIGVVNAGREMRDRLERALAPAFVYIIATVPMHGIQSMYRGHHPPAREQECRLPILSPPVRHPRDQPVATVARQWNRPRSRAQPVACCWPPTRLPLARAASQGHLPGAIRRQRNRCPAWTPGRSTVHPLLGRQPSPLAAALNHRHRLPPARGLRIRRLLTSLAPRARSVTPCARRMRA
jgi:ribosome modulation factor